MFKREQHNVIAKVLRVLNTDLFLETECYFGGGTAIVLLLDEYRESADIDFLCASEQGYRKLRERLFPGKIDPLLKPESQVEMLRDIRADQYGIRTWLGMDDLKVKFEIVREGRVELDGALNEALEIPVLKREDLYCEKLLANADRFADKAVLSRDIIDLAMMISRWGDIPEPAWAKARGAYGTAVDAAYEKAAAAVRNREWLVQCMRGMAMEPSLADEILTVFGGPLSPE